MNTSTVPGFESTIQLRQASRQHRRQRRQVRLERSVLVRTMPETTSTNPRALRQLRIPV
jgi:hypothetical protein